MNFLVVVGNRLLNRFLTTYLRGKGHSAQSLTDHTRVEPWLELNPCDGIIMEICFFEATAMSVELVTLITQIRAKFQQLPIVVFSKLGFDEDAMVTVRKAGASGYVSKGLGPSEIYAALMRCVQPLPAPIA